MSSSPSLVGTWTGCVFLGFNGVAFHSDGTADLDNFVVHYTFDGTRVKFSSLPPYISGAVEYPALLSSHSNLLTLSDTQGNFCVMARSGSSGEQELLSSLVGTWTGDCNVDNPQESLEFHHIAFLADGTFTSDTTYTFASNDRSPNGTYTIPITESSISDDYSILGLTFGDGAPEIFDWEISADGKTLTLSEPGSSPCSLARLGK